jgi:hypothetical protein
MGSASTKFLYVGKEMKTMYRTFIEVANENIWIFGIILCVLCGISVILLSIDTHRRKKKIRDDKRMQRLYLETDEELRKARAEIKALKTELFAARCDAKFAQEQMTKKIGKLETEKKQILKWGSEK